MTDDEAEAKAVADAISTGIEHLLAAIKADLAEVRDDIDDLRDRFDGLAAEIAAGVMAEVAERWPEWSRGETMSCASSTTNEPDELARLKAALFKAHPDHGGSNAAFRRAYGRYERAKRRRLRS